MSHVDVVGKAFCKRSVGLLKITSDYFSKTVSEKYEPCSKSFSYFWFVRNFNTNATKFKLVQTFFKFLNYKRTLFHLKVCKLHTFCQNININRVLDTIVGNLGFSNYYFFINGFDFFRCRIISTFFLFFLLSFTINPHLRVPRDIFLIWKISFSSDFCADDLKKIIRAGWLLENGTICCVPLIRAGNFD